MGRHQYHYFYGSTDAVPISSATNSTNHEQEPLIGEALVNTDGEEETPNSSEHDLQHLVITNSDGSLHRSYEVVMENGQQQESKKWKWAGAEPRNRRRPFAKLTRSVLTLLLVMCMGVLAIILSPRMSAPPAATMTPLKMMPFPTADRTADPVSAIVMKDLFHPSLVIQNGGEGPDFTFPFPTGSFWTNLVLEPTPDRGLSFPVVVYPYAYRWSLSLMQVSYPVLRRRVAMQGKLLEDSFAPDITFGTQESMVDRHVVRFDPLSVTIRFVTEGGGLWESYLVQGSPYVTVKYEASTPIFKALSTFRNVICPDNDPDPTPNVSNRKLTYGVCSPSATGDPHSIGVRGVQFLLQTAEGFNWIAFASEPLTLEFDTLRRTVVKSVGKFTGVIRLALIPPSTTDGYRSVASNGNVLASDSTGTRRLIYHAGVFPVGGTVAWDFGTAGTASMLQTAKEKVLSGISQATGGDFEKQTTTDQTGTVHFRFETSQVSSQKSVDLLMLALPHHTALLSPSVILDSDQFDLTYQCIKGAMTPVLGDSWSYDEPLPSLGFDGVNSKFHSGPSERKAILENVEKDLGRVLPTLDENVYGFGKQVARLAQLAHIANVLEPGNVTSDNQTVVDKRQQPTQLKERAVGLLASFMEKFLSGQVKDFLVYDSNLGGLVTKDGIADSNADFGNGRYNDHHFHYGYILFACAVLGSLDTSFVTEYGAQVDAILLDVANMANDANAAFFPFTRHKSWFDGHSFASGLFPFGTGKSQESSSEAVNCYYGAYLWSLVRNGAEKDPSSDTSERTNFMRLLLAMEIRGAKKYWHLSETVANGTVSEVYPLAFMRNYMAGNVGMLTARSSTWFGSNSLYVHMINFIPITAVTQDLFDISYVQEEFPYVMNSTSGVQSVQMAWRGYVVCDNAIIDPVKAWEEAKGLVSYEMDSAISKSQVLYWISTRGEFPATMEVPSMSPVSEQIPGAPYSIPSPGDVPADSAGTRECETNAACLALGLSGFCCPTTAGAFLDCCHS